MDNRHTDKWTAPSVHDGRPGSLLCQTCTGALGPWAETIAPETDNVVLCSTQATPNEMAVLSSPGRWGGDALGA